MHVFLYTWRMDCYAEIVPFAISTYLKEKGRDLTQSYDKSPYTNRNVKRAK